MQTNFLRPTFFDVYTDESNPNFQSVMKERDDHETDNGFRFDLPYVISSDFQSETIIYKSFAE